MTAFNLEEFRSQVLDRDLARPNLFEVNLHLPKTLFPSDTDTTRIVSLFCDSASFPTHRLSTKRLNIYGETQPRVNGVSYGEGLTLSFILDADMKVKAFFDKWLDMCVDRNTYNVSYQADYVGEMSVHQLKSKNHTISYTANFQGIFPTGIMMLNVDNNHSNSVHRLDVSFEYYKWDWSHGGTTSDALKNATVAEIKAMVNKSVVGIVPNRAGNIPDPQTANQDAINEYNRRVFQDRMK